MIYGISKVFTLLLILFLYPSHDHCLKFTKNKNPDIIKNVGTAMPVNTCESTTPSTLYIPCHDSKLKSATSGLTTLGDICMKITIMAKGNLSRSIVADCDCSFVRTLSVLELQVKNFFMINRCCLICIDLPLTDIRKGHGPFLCVRRGCVGMRPLYPYKSNLCPHYGAKAMTPIQG